MKSIRLFYSKSGTMRFISHLDMNRFITRAVRKADLPIWYTEGFHPHPYINFALPLSLGFESNYEILDLKLTDDDYNPNKAVVALNSVCPGEIKFFDCAEPVMKTKEISFASYEIIFDGGAVLKDSLQEFTARPSIICVKKTKKGELREFDITPEIKNARLGGENGCTFNLTLPAGSEKNINPELWTAAFLKEYPGICSGCFIKRTGVYNRNLIRFK